MCMHLNMSVHRCVHHSSILMCMSICESQTSCIPVYISNVYLDRILICAHYEFTQVQFYCVQVCSYTEY